VRLNGHRPRWKVAAPVAGVAVLAIAAGTWAMFLRPSSAASGAVTYRATAASIGTIRQTVAATGTIAAADTEQLSFPSAGKVTSVKVTAGQKVAKGQTLASIDSATLRSVVAAAQASLASAKARLDTDQTADASSEQIAADQANIAVGETQLSQAQSALSGATLTASFAGTVTAVNVVAGQQVTGGSSGSGSGSSGSQGGTGGQNGGSGTGTGSGTGSSSSPSSSSSSSSSSSTAAIEIVSTGSYVVNASVDASDIALIAKNDQVVITPSTSSQTVFGLVSSVGVVATSNSGVASFPVVVNVTGSPTGLYIGATAELEIVYRQLTDVLVVPTLAITRSGDTTTVLVQSGITQTRRTVVTGVSSGGMTQIVSGLQEGEQVMVPQQTGTGGTGRTGTGRTGTGRAGTGRTGTGGTGNNGGNQGRFGGPPGGGPPGAVFGGPGG
jgi:macrolide-specific efflux system membrane fusion protein